MPSITRRRSPQAASQRASVTINAGPAQDVCRARQVVDTEARTEEQDLSCG